MEEAKFYKKIDGQSVVCELCRHNCLIKDGAVGICSVRQNQDGRLFSLVYGYPAALNVDPIEKKPLFHFQPGSLAFSLGTLGCNFKCLNCQNWDLSQTKPANKQLDYFEPKKIVEQAVTAGCGSIAYTYNEPTVFAEYALEIMKLARKNHLKNVWVTNGYLSSSCLSAVLPYLDAANVDLKSFEEKFYRENCGASLAPVLENLSAIKKSAAHLEITTLIVPGRSDDLSLLKELAEFIVNELGTDVPWHLSKFSPAISWKLKTIPATPEETIFQAYETGKRAGLKYVYVGNIIGDERENTYCPACGELAIRRFGYEVERLDHHGRCSRCDEYLDIAE